MRRAGIAVTALAAGLVLAAGSLAAPPKLNGNVGPGFTIALTKAGKKVTRLKAGRYTFVIRDRSSSHNFVLEREGGSRFERELTDVSRVGTKTVTLALAPGTYRYYCEPHASQMTGTFVVYR